MKFRYTLEPYSGSRSRYFCPNCNKKEYVRFIDVVLDEHLPIEFGRCNRQVKCGYFRRPSHNGLIDRLNYGKMLKELPKTQFLNSGLIQRQEFNLDLKNNPLFQFVCKYFHKQEAIKVFGMYQVKSQILSNSIVTLFPQFDDLNQLRALKKMKYNPRSGKRDKYFFRWHNPQKLNLKQCLFGLHLIREKEFENTNKVYIVESEKTAIISSLSYKNTLFMATGGLANLTKDRLKPLRNKRVILMPDLAHDTSKINPFNLWEEKGKRISKELNMEIYANTMLLEISTEYQKEQQWDLADFIISNKKSKSKI